MSMLINPSIFGRPEKGPLALTFSQTDNIDYTNMLPSGLIDLTETFASDAGQFTYFTENTGGTKSIASNKLTITHSGALNDIVQQNAVSFSIPQLWIESQVNVTTAGTSYDNGAVGIVKDNNNYLWCSIDRVANQIRVQIKIGGTNTFLASVSQSFSGVTSFKIALSLVGNSACCYINTGSGWVYKTGANVTTYYDFRTTGNLAGWKPGFCTANGGGTQVWAFSNLMVGRFGAVGIRDQTIVSLENGDPYFPSSGVVLFTATAVDPLGIGYLGVFRLDIATREVTQTSVIFIKRGGKSYADLSAHIIWYPNGNRRLLVGTWANGFGGSIQTLHALLTSGDILVGTNLVDTAVQITLPGQTGTLPGAYDAVCAYDSANSRWLIAYTLVTNTNFSGNPFYAAFCSTTDWSTFTLIAADTTHTGYEGTKLLRNNGSYYVLAGGPAGTGNSSRVYDAAMTYLGALSCTFSGGSDTQPHPMVFPYNDKQLILSFDNTKYGAVSFTWGNIRIYEAARY